MSPYSRKAACGGWGFAEATLFFILPDVLLSYFALKRKVSLLPLIAWATVGAIIGGVLMYYWGTLSPETSWQWVERVPAINAELLYTVEQQLTSQGAVSIILGPFQGLPYKTYAVQAYDAGISLEVFVVISIIARVMRFMLIGYVARGISHLLKRRFGFEQRGCVMTWGLVWFGVYLAYFSAFPS
ncbi:hypothetical protein [Kangiella marina]|uniref:DedA family protein n=1 Tax=Kangiella marina TaxID=1079178 RepID=A0ABP8IFE2_9GAMM